MQEREVGIRSAQKLAESSAILREPVASVLNLRWRHLITARTDEGGLLTPPTSGYTTWMAPLSMDRFAAISWDWVLIDPGVVTIENILEITSNLYPTDETGAALNPTDRLQLLVRVVSGLDWYDIVRDCALSPDIR